MKRNSNNIYFIQTRDFRRGIVQCWIVSSPTKNEAEKLLLDGGWIFNNGYNYEIVSSERVEDLVDMDLGMEGKTYIKMHN